MLCVVLLSCCYFRMRIACECVSDEQTTVETDGSSQTAEISGLMLNLLEDWSTVSG